MRDYYYPIDKILNDPMVYVYKSIRSDYVTNEVISDTKIYAKFTAHLDNYDKNLQEYDTVLTANYFDNEFNYIFQWIEVVKSDGTLILDNSQEINSVRQTPRPIVFDDSSICYSYQHFKEFNDTALFKITYRPVSKYANKTDQDALSMMFEMVIESPFSDSYVTGLDVLYLDKGKGPVYAKNFQSLFMGMDIDSEIPQKSSHFESKFKLDRVVSLREFEYLMSLKKP